MKYSGAEITIKLLERQGITTIAGIPGGANLPLYDALARSSIQHILSRHEQGAGFIAQGIARSTGKTAVCFATSGPGVVNLLTAIADAKLDSVPVVAITGQVASTFIGTDAFQEIDTYGMTLPITKHNFLVRTALELLSVIPEAFRIAASGRPGPVVVDIPKDVQNEQIDISCWPEPGSSWPFEPIDSEAIMRAAGMINAAKRPLFYIGGGVIASESSERLRTFIQEKKIPAVSTLNGLGVIADGDPLYLGMLGMHGSHATNEIVDSCDLLIALGVRFDDRATGKISAFAPEAAILHIDIDKTEFNKIKKSDFSINGNIAHVLTMLSDLVIPNSRSNWIETIKTKKSHHNFARSRVTDPLHPSSIIRFVGSIAPANAIITTDVGQHQMWVAQSYPFSQPRTLLTSGGLGTMGFGLPSAIGAALAHRDRMVICFSGDGSILMNIQELATVADHQLNVKVLLFNNGHLGLVRQQQELFYKKNYFASKFISSPDFAAIASGFGIKGFTITSSHDVQSTLAQTLSDNGPAFYNIIISHEYNVLPMVPPGAANSESIGE
ncbi:MAG TPA: biosynthetic-type acetolactate synthase large subunit [Chitinispirillaceae bacterium]|nr:biosynthetic-type acetolactate synthase large subunit [Chitinispirillaceae bacterium]